MNEVILKGLLKNTRFSHRINNNVEYYKADLIVPTDKGTENIIDLRFKKCFNQNFDNQLVSLIGYLRSYSQQIDDNKNRVQIYVSTYFDKPTDASVVNQVLLSGRVCKITPLIVTRSGKQCLHVILANNIIIENSNTKFNNYIPLVFWGNLALKAASLKVSDKICVHGELHSRTYTKTMPVDKIEIRTAHEVVVLDYHEVEF